MKIKTLTLIKTLLEEEVKNANDDFDEAMSNYKYLIQNWYDCQQRTYSNCPPMP